MHPHVSLRPDAHLGNGYATVTEQDLAEAMVGIEYRHGKAWIDEIPQAYKDIDQLMVDAEPLVNVVTSLRQIMNVKGQ